MPCSLSGVGMDIPDVPWLILGGHASNTQVSVIPATVGAIVSLVLMLRVFVRYERLFVSDAKAELEQLRVDIRGLRVELTECTVKHETAQSEIDEMRREIALLKGHHE